MKNQMFNKISKLTKASIIITGITIASSSIIANAADNKLTTHHLAAHPTQSHNPLKTQTDKVSYTIGYQIGESFKKNNVSINKAHFTQGLEDGLHGGKTALTDAQMKEVMMKFQKEMMAKSQDKKNEAGTKNLTASNAYIAKVAKMKDVKKITDGLYYKVLKAGKGAMPTANDTVTVNYEGKLISGKVFDSSYKRGKPAEFKVNQVIPGWTKALETMPTGSTWMLYIAPDLAYGKFAPPSIGPNQALIFKVELIKIAKAKTATATAKPAVQKK